MQCSDVRIGSIAPFRRCLPHVRLSPNRYRNGAPLKRRDGPIAEVREVDTLILAIDAE